MCREIRFIVTNRVKPIKNLCGENTQTFNDKAVSIYSIYYPLKGCNKLAVE